MKLLIITTFVFVPLAFFLSGCVDVNNDDVEPYYFILDTVRIENDNIGTIYRGKIVGVEEGVQLQFINLYSNCIQSIGGSTVNGIDRVCLEEIGPNGMKPLDFVLNKGVIVAYDMNRIVEFDEDAVIVKKVSLFNNDTLVGNGGRLRMNDNFWFDPTNFSDGDKYFFLVKRNTKDGQEFESIAAVDLNKTSVTLINVPKPDKHNITLPIAHFPLLSAMYYPYITVCNNLLILSYPLHNEAYFYDLSQQDSEFGGTWRRTNFTPEGESPVLPNIGEVEKSSEYMKAVKRNNYHYGPFKSDGSYVFQVYQKPVVSPDDESPKFAIRVFDTELSTQLTEIDLPTNLYNGSFSVVDDAVYIRFAGENENEVSLLRYRLLKK